MKKMAENMTFEKALARLEEIVRTMESGAAQLDKSLALFEEGAIRPFMRGLGADDGGVILPRLGVGGIGVCLIYHAEGRIDAEFIEAALKRCLALDAAFINTCRRDTLHLISFLPAVKVTDDKNTLCRRRPCPENINTTLLLIPMNAEISIGVVVRSLMEKIGGEVVGVLHLLCQSYFLPLRSARYVTIIIHYI